ncbi:AfsR/SARP family transcriptional regulator [Nocardia brasiliensis]|uniref:AfsR/SARP family transcriptional regulator n=2 Tax=Nocardia brasiliensis TaxID=37326 RepID=UPI002458857F|nr:BTAD domain-containing putative transcriptional regulator [Nocardia brasiliensis]
MWVANSAMAGRAAGPIPAYPRTKLTETHAGTSADLPGVAAQLSLFGGFELRVAGAKVVLPVHAQRVLAYLALHRMTVAECGRRVLAERLWENSSPDRSSASLRTALWRIRRAGPGLLGGDAERVRLTDQVAVDVDRFRRRAEALLAGCAGPAANVHALCTAAELLPGWDEDWLVLFREQLRLLRLHTLEAVARRDCAQGRYPQAIDLILRVVAEEPLRESAQAILIDAHLGEGNAAEARRQFDLFAATLWRELALRPSAELGRRAGVRVCTATTRH